MSACLYVPLQSEFYDAIMPYVRGKSIPDVFATRDETVHRMMKRPIANIYSMSNLVSFEPYVNSTMRYFFERLDELFVDQGKAFDFGHWLHLFAFDVMGELTFSKRLGFLENGGDIEGLLANNWDYFRQAAPVRLFEDRNRRQGSEKVLTGARPRRCLGLIFCGKEIRCFRIGRK